MYRSVLVFSLLLAGLAEAGQVEVGQFVGNAGSGANLGITSSYINGTNGAQCVGQVLQGNACVAGSSGGFVERNYDASLFAGGRVTTGGPAPVPFAGYTNLNQATAPGTTATSTAGVPFAMISDGTFGARPQNYWMSSVTGSQQSMTLPIGIYGVTDAYLMMNNLWGQSGGTNTKVTFNFADSSNALTGLTTVAVMLQNSSSTESGTGQIRSAMDCAGAIGSPSSFPNCNTAFASGTLAASSNPLVSIDGGTATSGPVTVTTDNVFSSTYSGGPQASTAYFNTAGQLNLDDQKFIFGNTYADKFLVSIIVTELNNVSKTSSTALSAVTLITAVPEPGTMGMMLVAGLLLAGPKVAKHYRNRKNS